MRIILAISVIILLLSCKSPSSVEETPVINIEERTPSIKSFPTPYSGSIKGLHVDNSSLLLASDGINSGLFKYDIQTGLWERLIEGHFSEVLNINKESIIVGGGSGAFISKDNGKSWKSILTGEFLFRDITDLTIGLDNSIIAVLNNSGTNSETNMVRSSNGESNWIDISTPERVQRVILHNDILYANGFKAVYSSTNNGKDWNLEFNGGGHSIFADGYGSVWVIKEREISRLDEGNWTSIPLEGHLIKNSIATIDEQNQIYFVTGKSVYRYYPEAGTIELITNLNSASQITNLEAKNGTLYISTISSGLYTVSSSATNSEASLIGIPILALELLKDNDNNLFLRSGDVPGSDQYGLYLKKSDPDSWDKISSANNHLAITPNDGLVQFVFGKTVKYSKDLGTTWEQETLINELGQSIFASATWIGINQKLRVIGYPGVDHLKKNLLEYDDGVWTTLLSWEHEGSPSNVIENSHGIFIAHDEGLKK